MMRRNHELGCLPPWYRTDRLADDQRAHETVKSDHSMEGPPPRGPQTTRRSSLHQVLIVMSPAGQFADYCKLITILCARDWPIRIYGAKVTRGDDPPGQNDRRLPRFRRGEWRWHRTTG